jgi:peptidoglycan pentaglycine glycine transferase (the first glycine)
MTFDVVEHPTPDRWNEFASTHPRGTVFQSYEWGQIRRAQGWEPHYLALQRGGVWHAACLVLAKTLPGGLGTILYSPRGPLVGPQAGAMAELIRLVVKRAADVRAIFWRIDPPVRLDDVSMAEEYARSGFHAVPQEWSYWNRPKYEMLLDLSPGEAAVFARLGSKIRTKIRHAGKRGVTVDEACGEADIDEFHRLMRGTGIKKGIPVRSLVYFRALYDLFVKSGMARLFLARKDGAAVAGGLTVRFGHTATLLYLSNDYSMQRAGWAVQWDMIRWAIAHGCTLYDFGGTGTSDPPKDTDKGYGVYQFKRSFGAEMVRWYGYADLPFSRARYAGFRLMERLLPYGERVFLEWPKVLSRRHGGRPSDGTVEKDQPSSDKP